MFEYKHRVRYYETDKMGVAHHSSFVFWCENARIEFLRNLGLNYSEMEKQGFNMAVVEIKGRFLKPVFFDQIISVKVSFGRFDEKFARFDYEVSNEEGEIVLKGYTKHLVVDKMLKRANLPEEIVTLIEEKIKNEK